LDKYSIYCGDQQRSGEEMRRAESDNVLLQNHLEAMLLEKECRKLDIYAYLLLPMQRVTKYPLLLKSLLKKTPEDHADYEFLKASISEIEHTIKSINEYTKRRDEIARILTIEKKLDCSQIKMVCGSFFLADICLTFNLDYFLLLLLFQPINLANSEAKGRTLIREGALTRLRMKNRRHGAEKEQGRKLEKLHIFFFSDMVILTKPFRSSPDSPPRYIVQVKPLRLSEVAVRNVPDSSNGVGAKNVFLISGQAIGTIVLQTNTPEEKTQWVNDFRSKDMIGELSSPSLLCTRSPQPIFLPQKKKKTAVNSLLKVDAEATEDVVEVTSSNPLAAAALSQKSAQATTSLVRNLSANSTAQGKKDGHEEQEEENKEEAKHSWFMGQKKPEGFLGIAVEQLSQPEFDGWLKVLSKGAFQRPVWKWRYCVLKDFVLYFFLGEEPNAK